ncbi:hypothetical protein ACOACQ_05100 [Nocardioides sp. CPCC 206347]|uniref:hypothetical protein n=1 Tax=unclassified Nocardioides TaxID=2615069 RepID=UPI0036241848
MKVIDDHGQVWRVTRRWLPWRPHRHKVDPSLWLDGVDDPIGFLILLVIGFFVLPVVLVGLFLTLEVLLILLLLPFAVIGRIALGKHWWVEARKGFSPYWEVQAGNWRQSRDQIRKVAGDIERGDLPLRTLGLED